MTLKSAKLELERRIGKGLPYPKIVPKGLLLEAIKELPEVFQHRSPLPWQSTAHAHDLAARVTELKRPLDMVTVIWAGDGWVIVDGHHRLQAYRIANWRKEVPVNALAAEYTIERAMGFAVNANSKDRLPMSKPEKTNAAWRLVTATNLSKADTARAAGVSERSVAYMRKVRDELHKSDPQRDLTEETWATARGSGQFASDGEPLEWGAKVQKEAEEMANKFAKVLGTRGHSHHEALALALELYDQRLPEALWYEWENRYKYSERKLDEEESDF